MVLAYTQVEYAAHARRCFSVKTGSLCERYKSYFQISDRIQSEGGLVSTTQDYMNFCLMYP